MGMRCWGKVLGCQKKMRFLWTMFANLELVIGAPFDPKDYSHEQANRVACGGSISSSLILKGVFPHHFRFPTPPTPPPLSYYSRKGNNKLRKRDQTSSLIAFLCLHKEIYHNYIVSLHLWHRRKIMSICHDVKLLYCLMRCIVLFMNKTMYVE
jgi:hypothetical protein